MTKSMPTLVLVAALLAGLGPAAAAEPVVGDWQTLSGETARIAPCGDAFCISLVTGKFKGREIGRMSGSGGSYGGEITDPEADRTYSGSAEVAGGSMKLTGCALKIFCKSQTWTRR